MKIFIFERRDDVKITKSATDAATEYVEDGDVRLIFREGKYVGWYMPGKEDEDDTERT